jgi:hypothetical protein
VQRTKDGRRIHGGDVPNARADGLGLDVEVRLSRIARVPDLGNRLAQLDVIADLDSDAAGLRCPICRKLPSPISMTTLLPA